MILRRVDATDLVPSSPDDLPDVSGIVASVRTRGDQALADAAERFGDPPPRRLDARDMRDAYDTIDATLRTALDAAARRIGAFARLQRDSLTDVSTQIGGFVCSHRALPVARAGVYVPGGRYSLPSSLLMGVIPARIAGVAYVAVCTPVATPAILAGAHAARADCVFELGGAQAIAALAYGTESIPRVDTIVGPGNRFVTAAKRVVTGACGVDMPAGPSEVLIVASNDAAASVVAADLLAQAEHDVDARATLVTDDPSFADAVDLELERLLPELATRDVARASLARNGRCTIVPLEKAIDLTNRLAPEHLQLHGERAEALANDARCYGALFVGQGAGEVFGDYGAGPNHVLPTGGSARFAGGLSVFTFLTVRTAMRAAGPIEPELVAQTATLAKVEGLDAHCRAALMRAATVAC